MSAGQIPTDDNYKPVLALMNDATGQVVPLHVGALVTGADGKQYAKLDADLSASQGYVAAYGSNPAALTANTDYQFKWGAAGATQVNHVMIQNNSGATLNWDLDVAATAGSPTLANGSTLFLDVQTTVLHLLQNGTPNVNGASSGNIVVRGWL